MRRSRRSRAERRSSAPMPRSNSESSSTDNGGSRALDAASFAQAVETALAEQSSYDRTAIRSNCAARYAAHRIVEQYEQLFSAVARS